MPTKSELEDRNAELASELADVKRDLDDACDERDDLQEQLNDTIEADAGNCRRADEAEFAIGEAIQALRDGDLTLAARILEEAARAPKFDALSDCLLALKANAPTAWTPALRRAHD